MRETHINIIQEFKKLFMFKKVLFLIVLIFLSGCTQTTEEIKFKQVNVSLPTHDVIGKDIENLQRFQGLTRYEYSESGCSQEISYYTKGNKIEDIKEFYINELKKINYKLDNQTDILGSRIFLPYVGLANVLRAIRLNFSKENYSLSLTIEFITFNEKEYTILKIYYKSPCNKKEIKNTEINPYYTIEELKIEDKKIQNLNSIFKPILTDIFSGAKLKSYEYGNYTGFKSIILNYFTLGEILKKDIQVLRSKLENKSYIYLSTYIKDNGFNILFTRNNKLALDISSKFNSQEIEVIVIN